MIRYSCCTLMIAWAITLLCVPVSGQEAKKPGSIEDQIKSVLQTQTECWNRGDLKGFMETYWKSPKLSFSSGGRTTYGWQETLDRYRDGYAPPKEMGKLYFDQLDVSSIESQSALALGQWHLTMQDGSKREGNFSLVLKKMDEKWKIIHDHSSLREPETEENSKKQ